LKRHVEAVPQIDHADGDGQIREIGVVEFLAGALVDFVGDLMAGDLCDGFGPFKGDAFFRRKHGGVAPGGEQIEALLRFTGMKGALGMEF
jgi:hypothetical protein